MELTEKDLIMICAMFSKILPFMVDSYDPEYDDSEEKRMIDNGIHITMDYNTYIDYCELEKKLKSIQKNQYHTERKM